jgi:hypothetical protein
VSNKKPVPPEALGNCPETFVYDCPECGRHYDDADAEELSRWAEQGHCDYGECPGWDKAARAAGEGE